MNTARETYGLLKGAGIKDISEDMKANAHGHNAAKSNKYTSAEQACSIFRPKGLDEKY